MEKRALRHFLAESSNKIYWFSFELESNGAQFVEKPVCQPLLKSNRDYKGFFHKCPISQVMILALSFNC